SGRCWSIPVTTLLKVCAALAVALKPLEGSVVPPGRILLALSQELGGITVPAPPPDPNFVALITAYHALPPRHRQGFLQCALPFATYLTTMLAEEPSQETP